MQGSNPEQRPIFSSPRRFEQFGSPSVWLEFSPLATACDAVNLGQGFPGWDPPEFVTGFGQDMLGKGEYAQYARSAGSQILARSIATHYGPRLGKTLRWDRDIIVTVGCSEAIFLCLMALLDPGDEVLLLEPAFDIYGGAIAMMGGKAAYVPLTLGADAQFHLDYAALEASITPHTKALILNTPHNPTGKVFSKDELQSLGLILKKHPQIVVISDEVYEHLVYDEAKHIPFATIPGMAERTLSLYSAGKTFSITGWKIGWVIGPEVLIKRLQIAQQWVVFSVATPLQAAVAHCLDAAPQPYQGFSNFYDWLKNDYQIRRDVLWNGLTQAGLASIKPSGSFFIPVDLSNVPKRFSTDALGDYPRFATSHQIAYDPETLERLDYNFCRQLSRLHKVTPIPLSAFSDPSKTSHSLQTIDTQPPMARFAFCKPLDQLAVASKRLTGETAKIHQA